MTEHSPIVSLENAVARMINLDYIPDGFTLLEMTRAFMHDAKEHYERGQFIGLDSDAIFRLKYRYKACKARHELAEILLTHLYSEFSTADDLGSDTLSEIEDLGPSVYLDNLSEWASDHLGISLQPPSIVLSADSQSAVPDKTLSWQDTTIKLYADNYLGFTAQNGKFKRISFGDIDLMGKRKNEPNELGGLLIGLSLGNKFPPDSRPKDKEKTLISKLRKVLKTLTGNERDPFYPLTPDQGWKPKFILIDDRKNAQIRAEDHSVHMSYDDNRDNYDDQDRPFEDEDEDEVDEASQWLKDNQ